MKTNVLGSSDLVVTEVCLGTMTWGVQNSEEDAHAQLDYAIKERGVNFIDTAELYPVPSSSPKWKPGRTEEMIGSWLERNPGVRKELVIATKVAGFSKNSRVAASRDPTAFEGKSQEEWPDARLDASSIVSACEGSLQRLKTTYIDLYQLHWPDRYVPLWGARNYEPSRERDGSVPIKETLLGLKKLLDSGKIRHYGLSNETTYGVAEFVRAADELGMPRPVSIQNQFSLTNRSFEGDLAEACAPSHYNIGLLPWSILGGGALTGKYLGKVDFTSGKVDPSLENARLALFPNFQSRFFNPQVEKILVQYEDIAKGAGMSLATLAHAFCKSRWYIPSTIIGATTLEQLKENLDAFEIELSEEILAEIDAVHGSCLDPTVFVN